MAESNAFFVVDAGDIDVGNIRDAYVTVDGKRALLVVPVGGDAADTKCSVGEKDDLVGVPYERGDNSVLAHLNTNYYHIHGKPFVYPLYAQNVTITSAAGAWNNGGDIIEVVPAGALDEAPFDLHWINVSNISGNLEGVIELFQGPEGEETFIGATRIFRTSNFVAEGVKRIQVPQLWTGARVSARLADSTSSSQGCGVSFEGHYYKGL